MARQVASHRPRRDGDDPLTRSNQSALAEERVHLGGAAAALVPCLLFYGVTEIPGARLFTENHPLIMIPVLIAMAACVAVACITGIRERLAAVTRESIVDNIREL